MRYFLKIKREMPGLILVMFILCLLTASAQASVGLKYNHLSNGAVTDIDLKASTDATVTFDGAALQLPILDSDLFAIGTGASGGTSMATTDLTVPISYAYIKKAIASDAAFSQGTLPNGNPGQILTIEITQVVSSGTYTLRPTTSYGWSAVKFTAAKDIVTFQYIDNTTGWVVVSNEGSTQLTF